MLKKKTGVCYTPADYRKLNHCVSCNRASSIDYGEMCETCKALNFKYCEMCDIRLRAGYEKFYAYDTKEELRDENSDLKVSKEMVCEFEILRAPYYPPVSETLCSGCADWEKRMKNKCWVCGCDFENSKQNYKDNGNLCNGCVARYEQVPDEGL